MKLLTAVALLLLALAPAGCLDSASDSDRADGEGGTGSGDGDGDGDGDSAPAECVEAPDCMAASSTCCGCPTFAVPLDGADQGCGEIECEPDQVCPLVEATCEVGQCALVCSPVVTELVCEGGFARDDFGCLVDCCAEDAMGEQPGECMVDGDCVQVPADCCGCDRGGADTAVPADEVDAHLESLDCSRGPACPEVDVCRGGDQVRCSAGRCLLVSPPTDGVVEAMPCGSPDHTGCADGFECVLNAPDASNADALDVGSCQPR